MSEFAQSFAVVVGIDQYRNGISSLQTATQDAREIARILEQEYKYDQVWLLLDEQAALEKLLHLVEQVLVEKIQPDDRLLFYFAGHGIALNGDEGPEGYLIPQDAKLGETTSYFPMPKLEAALRELPCRHFLGILDCCFAGAFRWSSTRDLGEVPEVLHQERYDRFIADPAWQVITSAAYDQKALDSLVVNSERGQTGNHSPFAAALIEALAGKADLYPPAEPGKPAGDGVITATELYLYLRDRVEPATEGNRQRQTPGIWPLKKHDKGEYIFLSPGHVLNLPPAPPLDESKNPYRGLRSFEEEQSDLFFGRQALTESLADFVNKQFLSIVLGASGSGKSSLVKAGLISYLKQQDAKAEQAQYRILAPMRPGESPFKALSSVLAQENVPGISVPEAGSEAEADMLTQYMAAWTQQHPETRLLLAIDQFEELITLCRDEKEREQFLNSLVQALTAYPEQLRLVLTLRSDFEPQFQDGLLKDYWSAGRFVVPPMTRSELRDAIEEPATKRVMYFQSDNPKKTLVEQLIDEVADMPGALPLLSFTLSELYLKYLRRQKTAQDRGDSIDRSITEADYKELGGVVRSLTQRADQEYEAAQQEGVDEITIRNVMLRMVAISGGELTRRRVQKSELMYPEPKNEQVQKLIERFSAARLLVEGLDTENQEYVEPAHDQLVTGWGKIKTWLNERQEKVEMSTHWTPIQTWFTERSAKIPSCLRSQSVSKGTARPEAEQPLKVNLPLQRELTIATNHWNSKKAIDGYRQAIGFLWDGDPRLPQLQQTQQAEDNWFNARELDFVNRSIQRKRNNFYRLVGTIVGVFMVLGGLTLYAFYQLQQAQRQQVNQLAATSKALLVPQPVEAEINAIAAIGLSKSALVRFPDQPRFSTVESSLLGAIQGNSERNRLDHENFVTSVAFSSDGQMIVSSSADKTVRLWNARTGKIIKRFEHEGIVNSVAFSPDGQTIVSGSDNTVRLWNVRTGKIIKGLQQVDLKNNGDDVTSVAFSPDGQTIVSGSKDNTVRLWNARTGKIIKRFEHEEQVTSVAFSPDGQTIVSGSYNTVRLWNARTGKIIKRFEHEGIVNSVAFSPDGQTIVSGSADKTVRLWNARTGESIGKPLQHEGDVNSVAFSPDGQTIVSGSGSKSVIFSEDVIPRSLDEKAVRLWNARTGELIKRFEHEEWVTSVAFSPDGQTIVSGSADKTVRVWNARTGEFVKRFEHEVGVTSIAFSPDGQTIVSGNGVKSLGYELDGITNSSNDNTVRLWNARTGKIIKRFEHEGGVNSVAFSPDGQTIVSGSTDNTVRLWNARTGELIKSFEHEQGYSVNSVAFSPDGQAIVSGSDNGKVQLWNARTGELIKSFEHEGGVKSVAFSPDGQAIVSGSDNGKVQLWNARTGESIGKPLQHGGAIFSVAFSPDGQTIASAGVNKTVRLWNARTGESIGKPLQHEDDVNSVAFSSDGQTIASGSKDNTVRLWNARTGESIGKPLQHKGDVFSVAFSPDGQTIVSGSDTGEVQLWNISMEGFLHMACLQLQYHSLLTYPTSDAAREAQKTCKPIWEKANLHPSPSPPSASNAAPFNQAVRQAMNAVQQTPNEAASDPSSTPVLAPQSHNRGKIHFAPGKTVAQVASHFQPSTTDRYTFKASTNQPANLTINTSRSQVLLKLLFPSSPG